MRYVAAPKLMERFNGFPAVKITGSPAPGFSSGQALAAMEAVARETLPGDFSYAWAGQALQEKQAGGTSAIAFVGGLIVVFLLLAAQFEKWTLPIAVVLTVPIAILGALLLTWVRGLENDVYFQVGLVTLVGLSAKNAILICEFAIERVRHGMAVEGGGDRGGRPAAARDRDDLARVRSRLRAARDRERPGREQPARDRHRRDRRDPRLDRGRGVLRAALLLDAREHERALRREESSRRGRARRRSARGRTARASGRATDVRRLALAAVVAALVSGCTVGPDYSRPSTESPDKWRIDYPAAADVANTRWWEQFNDPALNQLIDTALRENRDLLIAAARVDQFVGQLAVVRSQFYPQIGYSADVSRNRASRLGNPPIPSPADPYYTLYQGALSAQWQIDLFGRVRRQSEAAQAQVYASEQGRRGVILTIVTSVATSYIALRGLDRQLEIALETAKNYAETARIFDLRFKGGVVSEVELKQVESQYQQALAAIPALEQQIAAQENLISVLLGRNPGPIPRGRTIDEIVAPGIPADLPSTLLERRPDILQAEQTLVAANANIGAAKALYFPTLSLTGLLGSVSTAFGDFLNGPGDRVDGRRRAHRSDLHLRPDRGPGAERRGLRARGARQLPAGDLQRLPRDQRRARRHGEEARGGGGADQAGRGAARVRPAVAAALRQRLRRLHRGAVRENELFAAELAAVQSQADGYTQLVNVYKAVGGGWVNEADQLAPQPQAAGQAPAPEARDN